MDKQLTNSETGSTPSSIPRFVDFVKKVSFCMYMRSTNSHMHH